MSSGSVKEESYDFGRKNMSRILTVGPSPFNNTAESKIHADILRHFKHQSVAASVWHHVSDYYMPDAKGKFYFDNWNCQLFVLEEDKVASLYEQMKAFNPNVLISIGDYDDSVFPAAIKKMYPTLFQWIGIICPKSVPFNDKFKDAINYLDYAFLTSAFNEFKEFCDVDAEYLPYRPNLNAQPEYDLADCLRISAISKNSQQSNIAVLMKTVEQFAQTHKIKCYLHTNVDDKGDYDIHQLHEECSSIDLPVEFVSFYSGISDEELMRRIAASDTFVDCSMSSATGLSAYEAAYLGNIPIATNTGGLKDLFDNCEDVQSCLMDGVNFFDNKEGVMKIISQNELYNKLMLHYKLWENDPDKFVAIKQKMHCLASGLISNNFGNRIEEKMEILMKNNKQQLTIDSIGIS